MTVLLFFTIFLPSFLLLSDTIFFFFSGRSRAETHTTKWQFRAADDDDDAASQNKNYKATAAAVSATTRGKLVKEMCVC